MTHNNRRVLIAGSLIAAFAVGGGVAVADTLYTAIIDGPSANTPSPAVGSATLILNNDETEVTYEILYSGLLGVERDAHFHASLRGGDGPILETLQNGSPIRGIWAVGPYEVGELNAGRVYINIHTDLYAIGEIRGWVTYNSVATEPASWSLVKSLYR